MTVRNFEPDTRWVDDKGMLTERAKGFLRSLFDYIGAGTGTLPVGSLPDHNDLTGLQGGTTGQYLHLTTAQETALHDAVTVADTTTVNLTVAGQLVTADAITQMSVTSDASGLKLSGDVASPGNTYLYGTNGSGVKGWYVQPAGGAVSDGDKGDVVVSGSGATWTLDSAISAKLVTNGDTHDHNGGDGAQIAYSSLSGLPTVKRSIGMTFDGGGSTPTVGSVGYVVAQFAGTIDQWSIVADTAGSAVVDVWKAAGSIPTDANRIAGTEKLTLTAAQLASDTSLSTWTTTVAVGDVLGFELESVSTCTRLTCEVRIAETL